MQAQLSAFVFVTAALSGAYLLTRSMGSERWYGAGFIFWFASVAVLFSLPGLPGISLIALAVLLVLVAPKPPEQKLPFLILIFCSVPVSASAQIPFPGINYLIKVDLQILIGTLLLAPVLLSSSGSNQTRLGSFGWSSLFMCAYFALTTILMFRVLPFTAGLRFGVEAVLGLLLIYLFILRFAKSEDILEQMLTALCIVAIVLACIAFLTQLKHWNFYSLLDSNARIFKAAEVRYGILRTNTTINSVLFGLIEAVGIVLLFRHKQIFGRLPKYGWLMGLLLALGFVVSMSRGAWLAGLVAFSGYFLLKSRLPSSLIVVVVISSAAWLMYLVFSGANISQDLDPFQTFEYRQRLYAASWDQFLSAPFIGNPFYLDSGRYDELVQGEGIVDIVSVYLQIVLQFGIAGLLLYIAPFLIALVGILRLRARAVDLKSRTLIASLGAFVLGYLAIISTVSGVNLIPHFGVVLAAMANAAVLVVKQQLETPANPEPVRPPLAPPNPVRYPSVPVRRAPGRGRNLHG